jgi:hypothetical protein
MRAGLLVALGLEVSAQRRLTAPVGARLELLRVGPEQRGKRRLLPLQLAKTLVGIVHAYRPIPIATYAIGRKVQQPTVGPA